MTRLLVVGMHNSPHLHRWIRMVARDDAAVLVFPSLSFPYNLPSGFGYVDLHEVTAGLPPGIWFIKPEHTRPPNEDELNRKWDYTPWSHSFVKPVLLSSADRLAACIEKFEPHVLHSMETQIAGYLCAETARRICSGFPPWVHSTWGSDLFLFRKLPGHDVHLGNVFSRVQVHLADCARDRRLAREFGYTGPDMPIIPASGGMDVDEVSSIAQVPPSRRKRVMIKGYHNWAGRGLLGLSAVMLAAKHLAGFSVGILAALPPSPKWAEMVSAATGLQVEPLTYVGGHREALARLATSRLVVGLGISDGLSTTVLEAMTLGSFPIQSSTSCCDEWVEHGRTGLIVSPHDTREIAEAVIRAATDDELVDTAAERNLATVRSRWNLVVNRALAWDIYDGVVGRTHLPRASETSTADNC